MKLISSTIVLLSSMFLSSLAVSQDLETGSSFEGNFSIDAMHTMDGSTYQVAASGEAC